ncbi:hypothetical protein CPB85DRAFT_1372488 [Mucidula mucida]|nr:hypothetical protein CPB85DRAFT_1372488 [Mucidula mucida]
MPRFSIFSSAAALSLCATALAADIIVKVGGPGVLKFDPESVNANVNDVIIFQFQQKNHTVTQSSLAEPCSPLDNGFDTGFIPVADSVTDNFPQANLLVSDTDPTWVYCRQGNHCQQGMVFAVNPGDKFDQFKSTATGGNATDTSSTTGAATSIVTVTATVTVSGSVATTTYSTTAPTSTSGSSSSSGTNHKVIVGGDGKLTYDPSNITADVGDTITFEFRTKNHTVTASSFAQPCRALSLTSDSTGFDSGFMAVAAGTTSFPTYTVQVNDTKPIWAYCRQTGHCGQGMVFSANAPTTGNTFDAFKQKAAEINGTGATGATSNTDGASGSNIGAGIMFATLAAVLGALL